MREVIHKVDTTLHFPLLPLFAFIRGLVALVDIYDVKTYTITDFSIRTKLGAK